MKLKEYLYLILQEFGFYSKLPQKMRTEMETTITDALNKKLNKVTAASGQEILPDIQARLISVEKKLSMKNDIWQIKNIKFYVPYYPIDFIQRHIVDTNTFFEEDILEKLDNYIPNNAIILDIGANIGNHTLYWLLKSKKAEHVYSFEPVKDTFEILSKNIEINGLKDKVTLYNFGLNDCETNADFKTYRLQNIGDTHLEAGSGNIPLKCLDEVWSEENAPRCIDFIKIDVEDMEIACLNGAKKILEKYKPNIFIESEYNQIDEVKRILSEAGYCFIEEYPHKNWLFVHNIKQKES